jgi:tRNA C32,U32 (ribose-2'-O)-methylase TrmJ
MPGEVRSLNLGNAVSVVLYEGLRRIGAPVPAGEPGSLEATEEPNGNVAAAPKKKRTRRRR